MPDETRESLSEKLEKLTQNIEKLKQMQDDLKAKKADLEAKKNLADMIFKIGEMAISSMEDHRKELSEKLASIK